MEIIEKSQPQFGGDLTPENAKLRFNANSSHHLKPQYSQSEVPQLLKLTCSQFIVNCIERLGVQYVFGIPGGNIEPFYNAIAESERLPGGVQHISSRHEAGAVFMAHGYARLSGKLGVVCTTTGPGATNALTGVCAAYMNYVPMLIVTAQTSLNSFGSGALQESACGGGVDLIKVFESCTRYNTLVSSKDQMISKLVRALSKAFGPNPGPVHLSIPRDILDQEISLLPDHGNFLPILKPKVVADLPVKKRLFSAIVPPNTLSKVPAKGVIWVGAYAQGCVDLILELAERLRWPVIVTPMGKGYVPTNHPNYVGVFGMAGHKGMVEMLDSQGWDIILGIGTDVDEVSTNGWQTKAIFTQKLIQLAEIPELLELPSQAQLKVLGSLRDTLSWLIGELREQPLSQHRKDYVQPIHEALLIRGIHRCDDITENKTSCEPAQLSVPSSVSHYCSINETIPPSQLYGILNQYLPANSIITLDNGNSMLWGINLWCFHHKPKNVDLANLFLVELRYASMGWAIGAAVGAAMARPNQPVLCVTGDGAFLMNGQEITVAAEANLNVIFVVLNDSSLGTVKHGQRMAGSESIAHELPRVNFAQMAEAVGVKGVNLDTVDDLYKFDFEGLLNAGGPVLLDVRIDPEVPPPLGDRVNSLRHGKQ